MLRTLKARVARLIRRPNAVASPNASPPLFTAEQILNRYVRTAPRPGNALGLFDGRWVSRLPEGLGVTGGAIGLFADPRIQWLLDEIDLRDQTALELGPLEGGHTAQLAQAGAASVTAVEANSHMFLKCLLVKEAMRLPNTHFLLGDFVEYLRSERPVFDVCVASGVLYHMKNPVELIELLSCACRRHLFMWTHYYDAEVLAHNPLAFAHFQGAHASAWEGFSHTLVRYDYQQALESDDFCGGSDHFSHWMPRADLFAALERFGFRDIRVNFDAPNHPNGPALALIASR